MKTEPPKAYSEQVREAAWVAALFITRIVLVTVIAATIINVIGVIVAEESILRVRAVLTVVSGEPRAYGGAVALMLVGGLWGYAYRRPVLGVAAGAALFIAILLSAANAAG